MTYKEYHDIFKDYFTERQIAAMQELAFANYEDAHGYRPMRKEQKQIAYDFIINFLRDMDAGECIEYLKPLGMRQCAIVELWDSLDRQ